MIRTQLMNEVEQWLTETDYNISLDTIINDFEQEKITFSSEELEKIEMMFLDEELRRYEEQAEMERMNEELQREWTSEMQSLEREWRSDRVA